jgi:hypothetical protein
MSTRPIVLLALATCTSMAIAAPAPKPRPVPAKQEDVKARGRTVLLGTWAWTVAGNKISGGLAKADVWWEQVSDSERNLVPQGRAGWALLRSKPFEKVGPEDLRKASYSTGKLSGSSLRPGTVVALRTRDGQYAKLKVVGYRDLHDTNFPQAKHLRPEWIRFARSQPIVKEYHLEVDWVLFKDKAGK